MTNIDDQIVYIWGQNNARSILHHFCFHLGGSSVGVIIGYGETDVHLKKYDSISGQILEDDISIPYTDFFKVFTNFSSIPKKELYSKLPKGILKESPLGELLNHYLYA